MGWRERRDACHQARQQPTEGPQADTRTPSLMDDLLQLARTPLDLDEETASGGTRDGTVISQPVLSKSELANQLRDYERWATSRRELQASARPPAT